MSNEAEVQIALRISRAAYAQLLVRQKEAKRLTGIQPSISAVVRAIIEESTAPK
jgi:hypothetical protein